MRDAQLEAIDDLVDVGRAVERLTNRQREVLALTVAGWTQEEIGEELGITHQVVSEHLAKARETLESYLQNDTLAGWSNQGRVQP